MKRPSQRTDRIDTRENRDHQAARCRMRVAIDIDGTITRCPVFFSIVSRALLAAGHQV